jgi:hypothetical protein
MRARRLRALFPAAVALALTGCASAGQAWRAGPAGIPAEEGLRAQMVAGQYGSALEAMKDKKVAPADALLRQMYKGLIAMHAGQSELGTRALDRAWEIAYQRWTKRIGDAVATMVTGEGALPYDPGPAEMMLIPYYGGLNWLARNERDEAAVEARRMSVLLADDKGPLPDSTFLGLMHYVAGAMFEVDGERNDAEVSYRNASALLGGRLPGDTLPPDAAHGDVVVLIEDGFVNRPEPAAIGFWVNDDDVNLLNGDDDVQRMVAYDRVNRRRYEQRDWSATDLHLVSLRWPVMPPVALEAARSTVGARVWQPDTVGGPIEAGTIAASVSDAVRADFERRQPARIARALARAALREVELKGAGDAFDKAGDILSDDKKKDKDKKDGDDEKDSGKGWAVAGAILVGIGLLAANVSSNILDQPDLRAWQLLPDRVTVARLRLPVGEHQVEVTNGSESYALGAVTVRPGSVTVLVHRWWPGAQRVVVTAPEPDAVVPIEVPVVRPPER